MLQKTLKKRFFPTVIISDLHLSKRKVVEADLLLEFLEHTDCDTLILNGDVLDGWHLEKKKLRPFPEKHARVMDAINKKACNGTKVIYIPGNHDERLRYGSRPETETRRFDKDKPKFVRTVTFSGQQGQANIHFRSDMMYKDPKGRRVHILHGDVFDPPWVAGSASVIGDAAYDALVMTNAAFSELSKRFNGGFRFSLAKIIKKQTKKAVGIIENFERAARNLPPGVDGMACGHIHHAEVSEEGGSLYINSGDWIESCTASVHDTDGNWRVVHWEDERRDLGLKSKHPHYKDNPNPEYRDITLRQLRIAQRMWPASNRANKILKASQGVIPKKDAMLLPG